jgi:hypothetical protein
LNSLEKVRDVIHKQVGHSLKRKMGRHGDGVKGRPHKNDDEKGRRGDKRILECGMGILK